LPLDSVQKPYYCETKFNRQGRFATTILLGLASVRSARACAANHRESITAYRHDDFGAANDKVTIEVTDDACPQHSCARGEPKSTHRAGALSASS
jgi:hypothetical protein